MDVKLLSRIMIRKPRLLLPWWVVSIRLCSMFVSESSYQFLTEPEEPRFGHAIALKMREQERYSPSYTVAKALQIHPMALSKVCRHRLPYSSTITHTRLPSEIFFRSHPRWWWCLAVSTLFWISSLPSDNFSSHPSQELSQFEAGMVYVSIQFWATSPFSSSYPLKTFWPDYSRPMGVLWSCGFTH